MEKTGLKSSLTSSVSEQSELNAILRDLNLILKKYSSVPVTRSANERCIDAEAWKFIDPALLKILESISCFHIKKGRGGDAKLLENRLKKVLNYIKVSAGCESRLIP